MGRHERDYKKLGLPDPANPDTWPSGTSGLYFVAFDLFQTAGGASKAAETSRSDDVTNGFTALNGSPLRLGEAIFQKSVPSSGLLSTIIVLQRGQVVVKIASACRGCPLGTVPAAVGTFVKTQLSQAESQGLPVK